MSEFAVITALSHSFSPPPNVILIDQVNNYMFHYIQQLSGVSDSMQHTLQSVLIFPCCQRNEGKNSHSLRPFRTYTATFFGICVHKHLV